MDFVQQNMMWVMLAAISGGMLLLQTLRGGGDNISVADATLKLNREDALIIDVRETHEWDRGHIPNARHIALGQIGKRIQEIEKFKSRPVIVVCASGNRSSSACGTLKRAGFEQVFNLAGGIGAWSEANLPVTTKH
ncbi:rhodanese-like domain-containing protein [Sulfurisoma sediminicola]|uniref:Rhodanese-related sulfurtransferase n=1 Tax=Sulfurisoma sediminicola TaxID=1381557 RepID=A0A497XIX4_9PROT|nr:rhodanese-like domain-containing protein [Sulfurisoma sediminicola]RLJ67804.1 rhodanese-related sulfurtransferase [Sulfurisoma sediminicola]